jgi:hypothetical protein
MYGLETIPPGRASHFRQGNRFLRRWNNQTGVHLMRIRFIILTAAMGLLAACMQSNTPERSTTGTEESNAASDLPLLQDPDGQPILEAPIDMLQDIKMQMLEKGLAQHAKNLEAAYDFKTGKARVSAPPQSK